MFSFVKIVIIQFPWMVKNLYKLNTAKINIEYYVCVMWFI